MTSSLFRKGFVRLVAALMAVAALAACSDDEPDLTGVDPEPISVDEIIVTPKSPTPGDTVMLTAVVTATDEDGNPVTNPGDFPTVAWSAEGGAGVFLDNSSVFVRWVAPAQSQLYGITCTATSSLNSASRSADVFVSSPTTLVSDAGEIYLESNETDFYYLRTTDISLGTEVWRYVGGSAVDVVTGDQAGANTTVSPTLEYAAFDRQTPELNRVLRPQMVYLSDFTTGMADPITTDRLDPAPGRRYQFTRPQFSPNGNLIAYQGLRPSFTGILPDTVDVYVHNITTGDSVIATETHGTKGSAFRRNNLFPTFSPDGNWVVFISDRTGFSSWELYGLPVTGDVVATDSSATVRLTNTGGVIVTGEAVEVSPPLMAWNGSATQPTLAILADDNVLRLMGMTPTGATETVVTGINLGTNQRVREVRWSNDGTILAVSTFSDLYTVTLGGAATLILTKPAGDSARDIVWSPNGSWWLYRVVRSGSAWYELYDLTGVTLSVPAVITAALPQGDLGNYSRDQNAGGVFTTTDDVLIFNFSQGRPDIVRLSVAGIVQ